MLKLHQQFFRVSLIFIILAFITASIFSYFFVRNCRIDSTIDRLSSVLNTIKIYKNYNIESLKELSKAVNARVTFIDNSGKVLFDSSYNKDKMDNHLNRIEITEAKNNKYGHSLRYSITLKKYLIYVAKKVEGGYLRLSEPLSAIKASVYRVVLEVVIILALFLIILFYFSNKMSFNISKDTKLIDEALEYMLNRDFSIYLSNINCCKEFAKIAKKIEKVAKRLKKREKQKSKYTKKLKEITKRQSDIISAISHEFKNPVAAIVGYSQTLKDTPNLNESLKSRFLEKIENSAIKISNMIDTLSLSIKLENQSISLNIEEFNLTDIAYEAKDILEQKYKNRDIILECENVVVKGDRNMFENVFINLIENALKYSEDEVVIKCNNQKVEIIDYGIGIDSKDIKKIKEKFYRADGISWNNSIGVGLYIVDYILKLHNLELKIKSDEKETVFSFNIKDIVANG